MSAPRRALALLALLVVAAAWALTAAAGPQPGAPDADVRATARFLDDPRASWPLIVPGVESRYLSSFDRSGGNADGFAGSFSTRYRSERGEYVIVDVLGPGVLRSLWFTGPDEGGAGLDLGKLRFRFDGEPEPRFEATVKQLFGGRRAPFRKPLVANNKVSTGGFASWVPLSFRQRLIVTTAKKPSFYIAQYDTLPRAAGLASTRRDGRDAAIKAARRTFTRALRAGGLDAGKRLVKVPLSTSREGAGTIELIELTTRKRLDLATLRSARVRIYWDGEKRASVDAPLGMFFGLGRGVAKLRAIAFSCDGRRRFRNRFPMPYWRGFRLEVSGVPAAAKAQLRIAVGTQRFERGRAGYFHTHHQPLRLTQRGRDFVWLARRGAGKLVGTVLAIEPTDPDNKRWWEGDLRSYVDGRRTPGLHGTGLEDDHLGGWSNTFFSRPFTLPMHGEPTSKLIERKGRQHNAKISLYRLWPGITFLSEIQHSVEHGDRNRVNARYGGLAFFYALRGGPLLVETDKLDLADAKSRAAHAFKSAGLTVSRNVYSAFEGRAYMTPLTAVALHHSGALRFKLRARADNRGCFLRRLYDQRLGRQRAAVKVDGKDAGEIYAVEGNSWRRWAERDFWLRAELTAGKKELELTITPAAKSPPFNAVQYRLLCVRGTTS
ncbi:MAG: DUF2961 domain-containing protein [Myxococcales bacterium]|nr:DUF2961 domain-containing protein [Myxococcales bacterium]